MRKIFSLIAAVLFAGSMMATTVTKTVAELAVEKSFTNSAVCTPFDLDEVISVSTSASDANTGKYYSNGEQIRLYQTGAASITLTAAEGYKISSVTLTYASQNTGILVEAESGVAVDFENVQSATFTVGNSGAATNGQARITAFSVTYDADGAVPPTPAEEYYLTGSFRNWATTAESDFHFVANPAAAGEYMLKGIALAANAEIKVIGILGENVNWYPAVEGNYTVEAEGEYDIYFRPDGQGGQDWHQGYFYVAAVAPAEPTTCFDVYQMAKGDVVDLLNDVTVTYANGKNVWVVDGSASMLIYFSANTNYAPGDVLSGIAGTVDIYNGVTEIKPSADQAAAIVATPGEVPAAIQTVVVEAADVNKYIVMPEIEFEEDAAFVEGTASNITMNGVVVRNNFKNGYAFEAGRKYNIYGVVTIYQNNPQVYFITAEKIIGTAINNTNIDAKVIKTIENGQLIIIKNGVRYNAQGAVVR